MGSVPSVPDFSVPTFSESYFGTEGNSQSVQIDLDTSKTSSQIWTDKYWVHLQPQSGYSRLIGIDGALHPSIPIFLHFSARTTAQFPLM
jgi:hypothetical protein